MGSLLEAAGGSAGCLELKAPTCVCLCARCVCVCAHLESLENVQVEVGDQVLDEGPAEWWLFWIHSEHKHVFNIILPLMENSLCVQSYGFYTIRVCALMVCVLACVFESSYMQNILK